MPNLKHASPDEAFDPAAEYAPCCHPKEMPYGTLARDSYDTWKSEQASINEAAAQEKREASEAFNAEQENNRGN